MSRLRSDDFHVQGKPLSWSALDRARVLEQTQNTDFDLVIVGGGITGAGIAREAALRGLSFLLVEKADFAHGTSSRSSKLVHGGIRYLSQGEYRLVRESTTERNWLRHALPNLVRPLPFCFCAWEGSKDSPDKVKLGVRLYDLISNAFSRYRNLGHRFLDADRIAEAEPALRREGFRLAAQYFDTNVDDARLTLETIKEARDFTGGRSVALNYVALRGVLRSNGRVTGVELEDMESGRSFEVRAACVVNATGIWTDETLALAGLPKGMIRPTKGVHIVVPAARIGNHGAVSMRSIDDGRLFFVLRRGEITVVGTTDTDYDGSLDAPWCERADAEYLLRTVNHYFPDAKLTTQDIVSTYAGIRPLIRAGGAEASAVSRKHVILDHGGGLVSIAGGKLTTFRLMGWELLKTCAKLGYLRPLRGAEARCHFSRRPFKVGMTWDDFRSALILLGLDEVLPEPRLRHLHQQYGQGAVGIVAEVKRCPALGQPLLEGHPFCPAEVHYILAFENAVHLTDVMLRRTEMQLTVSHRQQGALARRVAALMASVHHWNESRASEEISRYLDYIAKTVIA